MRVKDIVGFEGLYAVTDHGQIVRLYRSWHDSRGRLTMRPSRVLKCPPDRKGRRQVRLMAPDGRYRRAKVYQLVAEAFVPPYSGKVVNHIDGNPENDHYANLEWCSQAANAMHGQLRKSHIRLTATEITEVRQLSGTVPIKTICDRYNVDRTTVQRIVWGAKRKPR